MANDSELLLRYHRDRSEPAFAELVARHLKLVYFTALRQVGGDAHRAEDVSQAVFSLLAAKASTLVSRPSLAGWLHFCARFLGAHEARRERRRQIRETKAHLQASLEAEAVFPTQEPRELAPLVDEALESLSQTDKELVLLRYFRNESYSQISAIYGFSSDAARFRVDRALAKLRRHLAQRGVTSTAAAIGLELSAQAEAALPSGLASTIAGTATAAPGTAHALLQFTSLQKISFFMSTQKIAAGVAGALILISGGLLLHDGLQVRSGIRANASLQAQSSAAAAKADQLGGELNGLNQQGRAAAQSAPQNRAPRSIPAAAKRSYLDDPAYRKLALASNLARDHLEFQRFYRQRKLSPDQIVRFENIMAIQDQATLDGQAVQDKGGDPQSVYQQSGPLWSSEMTALLGDDGFQDLQDYLRARPVRAFVDSLAGKVAGVDSPLTPDQADQVAAIALANDAHYQSGKGTDPGTVDWDGVWGPAASVLSPTQLTTLQAMVQQWTYQREIQQAVAQKAGGNG